MADKTSRKPRKGATDTASLAAPARDTEAEKADRYIADQLKAIYDAAVVEPIPDHLLQLLDRLNDNADEK